MKNLPMSAEEASGQGEFPYADPTDSQRAARDAAEGASWPRAQTEQIRTEEGIRSRAGTVGPGDGDHRDLPQASRDPSGPRDRATQDSAFQAGSKTSNDDEGRNSAALQVTAAPSFGGAPPVREQVPLGGGPQMAQTLASSSRRGIIAVGGAAGTSPGADLGGGGGESSVEASARLRPAP